MSNRFSIFAAAFVLAGCGAAAVPADTTPEISAPPRIALSAVGDSLAYLEQMESFTVLIRPDADTLVVSSRHDAVIHVVRTAPDTLAGFYEHLVLHFESEGQRRDIDTDGLLWQRFVLYDGGHRISTVSAPPVTPEIGRLTDLGRQFEDFFLRVPAQPLDVGSEWVDTVRFAAPGETTSDRQVVTRFRVRGDTILHGLAARVIEYAAVIEANVSSVSPTQGTLTALLLGEEEGTFVYSPANGVMLARDKVGVLEGELVSETELETVRLPQSYNYRSRIRLIPPLDPDSAARVTPQIPAIE